MDENERLEVGRVKRLQARGRRQVRYSPKCKVKPHLEDGDSQQLAGRWTGGCCAGV